MKLFYDLKKVSDDFLLKVFELDLQNLLGVIQSRLDLFLVGLHVAEVPLGGLGNVLVMSLVMTLKLSIGDDQIREVLYGFLLLQWREARRLLVGPNFVEFLMVVFYDYAVSFTRCEGSDHVVSAILNLTLERSLRDQVALSLNRFQFLEDSAQFDCRLLEFFRSVTL